MATNLMRRRCRWIVYVTRQETSIAKTAGRLKGNVRGTAQEHLAADGIERN